MSLATPLPPAYSKSCSTTKSYQPFISTSDKRFTTPSKRSRWSRKVKNEERLPYAGPYSSDEKSLASSRTNSSSATSTRTTSTSDSTSLESSPASKSTKSTKSSRCWFKRVLLGASDEELNEDPEAKRMEKNAMWWNLSMGYENVHIHADVGEFVGRAFRGACPWTGGLPAGVPASVSPFYFGA